MVDFTWFDEKPSLPTEEMIAKLAARVSLRSALRNLGAGLLVLASLAPVKDQLTLI